MPHLPAFLLPSSLASTLLRAAFWADQPKGGTSRHVIVGVDWRGPGRIREWEAPGAGCPVQWRRRGRATWRQATIPGNVPCGELRSHVVAAAAASVARCGVDDLELSEDRRRSWAAVSCSKVAPLLGSRGRRCQSCRCRDKGAGPSSPCDCGERRAQEAIRAPMLSRREAGYRAVGWVANTVLQWRKRSLLTLLGPGRRETEQETRSAVKCA